VYCKRVFLHNQDITAATMRNVNKHYNVLFFYTAETFKLPSNSSPLLQIKWYWRKANHCAPTTHR